jgi:hypothetical protein
VVRLGMGTRMGGGANGDLLALEESDDARESEEEAAANKISVEEDRKKIHQESSGGDDDSGEFLSREDWPSDLGEYDTDNSNNPYWPEQWENYRSSSSASPNNG